MALTRVQGTAKVLADNAASISITFSTLPTVGNAIVIPITAYGGGDFLSGGCVDNRGNTYQLAVFRANGNIKGAVYYCSSITTASAPFTVTVTPTVSTYMAANAIEVSGVGPGLMVDQVSTGVGSDASPTSGAVFALANSEVLLVGTTGCAFAKASITVEVLSPAWVQEIEELSNVHAVGETDTRIVTSAVGTTPSAKWTMNSGDAWVAVVVAFAVSTASPTLIALVQSSGKAYASGGGSTVNLPIPTPTVGNGLVVFANLWRQTPFTQLPESCTDNCGNFYALAAVQSSSGAASTAVFYCSKVVSAVPGTILTLGSSGGGSLWWVVQAVEVSNIGTGLGVDQFVGATGSSGTPATGATAALTGSDVFEVAVQSNNNNQSFITVGGASPAWQQAFEELSSNYIAGEGDTRSVSSATGTTPSCSWTLGTASIWAALLVAFKANTPVVGGTATVQLSQLPIEVLGLSGAPVAIRLGQIPIEILLPSPPPAAQVSQEAVEVLFAPPSIVADISQAVIEVMWQPAAIQPAKLSQVVVEVLYLPGLGTPTVGTGLGIWMGDHEGIIWIE